MKRFGFATIILLVLTISCAPTITPIPLTFTPTAVLPSTTPIPLTPIQSATATPALAPELKGRFVAAKPTAQNETDQIWNTLQDIAFFDQYGYPLVFPNDPDVRALIQKARDKKLDLQDYSNLSKRMTDQLFNASDYDASYAVVVSALPTVEQVLPRFQYFNAQWGFKIFRTYTIRLTLYGVGGSYDSRTGEMILLTTRDGSFPYSASSAANTIIHEAVHIGIEEPVIYLYGIDQRAKERIVDRIVYDNFSYLLRGYLLQSIGDSSVDQYLQGSDAYDHLPDRIKQFKESK